MKFLGVSPGRIVGEALEYLLELRLEEGPLGEDEAYARLAAWARERGVEPGA
jgi:poly(A) polymerase